MTTDTGETACVFQRYVLIYLLLLGSKVFNVPAPNEAATAEQLAGLKDDQRKVSSSRLQAPPLHNVSLSLRLQRQ